MMVSWRLLAHRDESQWPFLSLPSCFLFASNVPLIVNCLEKCFESKSENSELGVALLEQCQLLW